MNKIFYTYRITNIVENKHYYGFRGTLLNPEDDIGVVYFSSSSNKNFIKEQKEYPERYKYKIIIKTRIKSIAQRFEIKLHKYFKVGTNDNFYNRATQTHTALIGTRNTARKAVLTRKTTFLENGLTIEEDAVKRASETGRNNNSYSKSAYNIYKNRDAKYRLDKSAASAKTMIKEGTYIITALKHRVHQNEIMESGLTRAQETGLKVSKTRKSKYKSGEIEKLIGLNNPAAKIINIFNNDNVIMYRCEGAFQKVCEENNLPFSAFKNSYQKDGKPYLLTRGNKSSFRPEFEGWYAKIEDSHE